MLRALPPSAAVMVVLCALSSATRAEPRVRVTVRSTCPSPVEVHAALAVERVSVIEGQPVTWHLRISGNPSGAMLQMVRADGAARHERRITSTDCRALADAFALIAAGHMRVNPAPPPKAAPRPEQRRQ